MVAVSAVYGVYGMFATLAHSHRRRECATPKIDPLARLGRSSLFVYWIHVELVYGYTTWLIRGRLPLWGTAIAYVAFCALMYGAIVLRDRLAGTWRARRVGSTTQTATA